MSGALTESKHLGWFECRSGLLERLQRGVALEALGESGCPFGTKLVASQPASAGKEAVC